MSDSARRPWRCRWFGHDWINPLTGTRPTWTIGTVRLTCARCGTERARHA